MLSRRSFVTGITASGVALNSLQWVNRASAQTTKSLTDSFGFIGPSDDAEFGAEITGNTSQSGQAVGREQSRHNEVSTAFRLLFDAPRVQNHMQIVQYFANLKEKNEEGELYNTEWKERANPLIVGFFSMTNTLPSEGDQVSWCAAFVSFILNASYKPNKFSALSGAYRRYGSQTDNPKNGDIAVFQASGERGKQGFGHVGFYLGQSDSEVEVIGGNQRGGTATTGAVTIAVFKKNDPSLRLHSFRTVGD